MFLPHQKGGTDPPPCASEAELIRKAEILKVDEASGRPADTPQPSDASWRICLFNPSPQTGRGGHFTSAEQKRLLSAAG